MSYMYNAAQDPFAMAYQSQRQTMLANPAYNVGSGQMGIGAYGTIGGVPIDMLNLPIGLGSADPNSILQQFDMQNSGILQLGAQLAGPNSQYSNLMSKYSTAVVVEQERARYQQQMQMQQMQMQLLQQQLAMTRQQQGMVTPYAAVGGNTQAPSTAAAPPADNSNMMLVLAMMLMKDDEA